MIPAKWTIKKAAVIVFISWFAVIGFDLFLHAGLLARLYTKPSPFLLTAEKAFIRIPLGYISFLILAIVLLWLMKRLNIAGYKRGAIFGLEFGALIWGAFILGLYSISTADWILLLAWWTGQTVELGIAGMVIGEGMNGRSLAKLFLWVVLFVILMIIITITLQILGFAPAMKLATISGK
ncbi:MAG: hypothetical protein ACYCXK_07740 [Candidatus Humimicrobiaceae bacterium]